MFGITDFTKPIVDFSNFEITQLGDALIFGGAVLLIGMATIFVILCLLWLCLILFKVFFHDLPEKRAKKRTNLAAMAVAESEEETSEADDGENNRYFRAARSRICHSKLCKLRSKYCLVFLVNGKSHRVYEGNHGKGKAVTEGNES